MIIMTIIIRYLVLFDEWYKKICDSIRYICKKVVLQIVLTVILQ